MTCVPKSGQAGCGEKSGMGVLARQSRLAQYSRSSFPCGPKILLVEGAIDRHSQEAVVVVVDDYNADTLLLAHGADFLA